MKIYTLALALLCSIFSVLSTCAQLHTENVVIITLDGLRWQEVFMGADSALLLNKKYTRDSAGTSKKFWNNNVAERRKMLFPFLWSLIAKEGQLYGNRTENNKVNVANRYKFSYPGYNEMFTGYPDSMVNSNDKIPNKNINVLEFINRQSNFKNKVVTFATWDVFPYILNVQRSGLYVNADSDSFKFETEKFQLLNDLQYLAPRPIGVRPDVITYLAAREYLKVYKPKVMYIAFDETDDSAHAGEYDQYLGSAHAQDNMIKDLWTYLQSSSQYKNKTTLIITCDHGRGDAIKDNWKHHGEKIDEADEIWIGAIGPDTKPLGEIKTEGQFYQKQLAATIAQVLGLKFIADHPIAEPISSIYSH